MPELAAVVLAGGAARRMAGALKPALPVGGVALLTRVLRAVTSADQIVVVGPPALAPLLPAGVLLTSEEPPGGGPVSAARAGVSLLSARTGGSVALLAADLPFLTESVVARLDSALAASGADGAVLVDDGGRPQWLGGVWRLDRLAPALAAAPAVDASFRSTVDGLRIELVTADGPDAPAWFDCDTEADLRRAEEWTHADPG
jgi:molybdopterin-guanine dinucleotide biosynthesis protein A